jgi:hypothetical protein
MTYDTHDDGTQTTYDTYYDPYVTPFLPAPSARNRPAVAGMTSDRTGPYQIATSRLVSCSATKAEKREKKSIIVCKTDK